MKITIQVSLMFSVIVLIGYLFMFAIYQEIPNVSSDIPFWEITLPWKISIAYDLLMIFPFIFCLMVLIIYNNEIKNKDYKLYRLINTGITISLILSVIIGIQISLLAGIITGVSICFLFGMGSLEFVTISTLSFGLLIWTLSAIKSGLLLGFLPGISASLIFGLAAFLGLGVKNLTSKLLQLK